MTQKISSCGTFGLHVMQTPAGSFIYVGSIPLDLHKAAPRSFPTMQAAIYFAKPFITQV